MALPVLLLSGMWTGDASAQGDTCSTADTTTLTGTGTFTFDLTGLTTSGFSGAGPATCTGALQSDGFFLWSAPTDGAYVLDTDGTDLGGASMGEVLSVYAGSDCSAACSVSGQGPRVVVKLRNVIAGQVFLIQAGSLGVAGPEDFLLEIVHHGPPANDTCSTAAVIVPGQVQYDNLMADTSAFDGSGQPCTLFGSPFGDVFFRYSPTSTGPFRVDTLASTLDTILFVHEGGDCSATCLMANDLGSPGVGGSRIDVSGVAGADYLIQVGGWSDDDRSHLGMLDVTILPPPPANDHCSTPTVLPSAVQTVAYDTTEATASGFDGSSLPCAPTGTFGVPSPDLFFAWVAPATGDYDIESFTLEEGTQVLNVHVGSDCSAVCYVTDVAGGGPGTDARVGLVGTTLGQPYLVQIGTWLWQDTTDQGLLEIRDLPLPSNNDCDNAEPIAGETQVEFDNFHPSLLSTGFDGGDPVNCPSGMNPWTSPMSAIHSDLFYVWTPTCDGDYVIGTLGSDTLIDTSISVHAGGDCTATCLASTSNGGSIPGAARLELFGVTAGSSYLIQVGASLGTIQGGRGLLTIARDGLSCDAGLITLLCDPAVPHFLGGSVTLESSSFGSGVGCDLHLEAHDGPPGEFGIMLVASDASVAFSIFNGTLCLNVPQGRYDGIGTGRAPTQQLNSLGVFDANGVFQSISGSAESSAGSGFDVPDLLPMAVPQNAIQPGDTWGFQLWYRDQYPDGSDATNFSNAIVATFP